MSIMVEYDLPKWCEGCNQLSTEKQYVEGIDFPHYLIREHLTCEHLNLCDALRTQWKLDDKQPATNCDKTQWISVKDKLPDNDERIIVIDEYSDIHRAKFDCGCWRELYTWFDIPNVELWMPEPELPMDAAAGAIQGRKDRRMSDTISRQAAIDALQGRK